MSIKSMTPSNLSSSPIGIVINAGFKPSFSASCALTFKGFAPMRSHLLTKARRGTWYRLSCRSTVIDWDCTPATEQSTRMAPSNTRRDLSTSIVKSTCPGVSMRLMLWFFHCTLVAPDWIVMPRSRSNSIESIAAPEPSLPLISCIACIFRQ